MVSIIIPCRKIAEAEKCVKACLNQTLEVFEIIVLPDVYDKLYFLECPVPDHVFIRIIETGSILPSDKRDIGIFQANGDIIAFIDADAYPDPSWLNIATKLLEDDAKTFNQLSGVCGAGIIPDDAPLMERAADLVLQILPHSYRVKISRKRLVDDYPTFNLILWRKYIEDVGGFNCEYLTGEDTLLCLKITQQTGKKILYSPMAYVYHSRRPLFVPFLRQIVTFGIHRGYFFKRYPETSRKLVYALPSVGVICLTLLIVLWCMRRLLSA